MATVRMTTRPGRSSTIDTVFPSIWNRPAAASRAGAGAWSALAMATRPETARSCAKSNNTRSLASRWATHAGQYLRAQPFGNLDGRQADTPRSAANKHGFAFLVLGAVDQREIGGLVDQPHSCSGGIWHVVWDDIDLVRAHDCLLSKGAILDL